MTIRRITALLLALGASVACAGEAQDPPKQAEPFQGPEVAPTAIPTFHCVGLYWKPVGGSSERTCSVKYKLKGENAWRDAMPLWFDYNKHENLEARSQEYRGSIVNLQPGKEYEVELKLDKPELARSLSFTTWSEDFKIAKRVDLPAAQPAETFVIKEGGTADGYVLYCPPEGQPAVWDAGGKLAAHIRVEASNVIIRGLTLKNAHTHGIVLGDVQNVVIEDCDISGWGRIREVDKFGENLDSAIFSSSNKLERVVIQRCNFHHPRSDSNSWREKRVGGTFHPAGPQGVSFKGGKGRFVIRYTKFESDFDHMFNDSMGEFKNFSFGGFPNRDSDIYENFVSHCWDDGIEIEGANMNVRVWHNYITNTYDAIGAASTSLGPAYYFRNIYAVSIKSTDKDANAYRGHGLIKLGAEASSAPYVNGRKFFLHNTTLQPATVGGPDPTSGAQAGIALTTEKKVELNIVSRNNILFLRRPEDSAIRDAQLSKTNDFDYDFYNGKIQAAEGSEAHGIKGVPRFEAAPDGRLWLKPGTPGHDAAQRLPNFNDDFVGAGPDMGAVESGTTQPKPKLWPSFPPPVSIAARTAPSDAPPADAPEKDDDK